MTAPNAGKRSAITGFGEPAPIIVLLELLLFRYKRLPNASLRFARFVDKRRARRAAVENFHDVPDDEPSPLDAPRR